LKGILRILVKTVLWTCGILIALVLLAYVLIRLPVVHDYARQKAVTYLREKLGTHVEVARLSIDFPKLILLEGVYFEDMRGDTLFAGDTLLVDISLLKLLKNTLEINTLELHGITAHVHRDSGGIFNFDYILDVFAAEDTDPVPSASPPLRISLDKIILGRIRANYLDVPAAIDMRVVLGHFESRVKTFDYVQQKFDVPKIVLKNSTANLVQGKPPVAPESLRKDIEESETQIPFDLQLGTLDFENIALQYSNVGSAIESTVRLGNLWIASDKLDLKGKSVALREILLSDSDFAVILGKTEDVEVLKEEVEKEIRLFSESWQVAVHDLKLVNNSIAFDDHNSTPADGGIDFAHLALHDLQIDAQNIVYAPDALRAEVHSAGVMEKSGIGISQFRGRFFIGPEEGFAQNVFLETGSSTLDADIHLWYSSLDSLMQVPGHVRQKAVVRNSHIAVADILHLNPRLHTMEYLNRMKHDVVHFDADIEGLVGDLMIHRLRVSGLQHTAFNLSGQVRGLPDADAAYFDLVIDQLQTRSEDVYAILPDTLLPEMIRLPDDMRLQGKFQGDKNAFIADLRVQTSDGDARFKGTVELNEPMRMQGTMHLDEFNLGRFLRQDTVMGLITLDVEADLRHMNTDSLSGTLAGTLKQMEYMGYTYTNLSFDGTAQSGAIHARASMDDPNLRFVLEGDVSLVREDVVFDLDLAHADLYALQFTDNPLQLRAGVQGDFTGFDPDSLNGTLAFHNVVLADSVRKVTIDTIHLVSTADDDGNTLELHTEFAEIALRGKYALTELFPAIAHSVNTYIYGTDVPVTWAGPQEVHFTARIAYSPLFTQLDSSIGRFSPVTLEGTYRSEGHVINIEARTDHLEYDLATVKGLYAEVKTQNDALVYSAGWEEATRDEMRFFQTGVSGRVQDRVITGDLSVMDSDGKQRFGINARIEMADSLYVISLGPENVLLNYEEWEIAGDNAITIASDGLMVRNFILTHGAQRLSVQSESYGMNSPIAFEFNNFQIETLTGLVSTDTLLAGGVIEGNALLREYLSSPVFTANLTISDFNFQGDTLGEIALLVDNETANTLAAEITLQGKGNDLRVHGTYQIESEQIDLTLQINRLALVVIEAASMDYIKDARGSMHGELDIRGTLMKPLVQGALYFDSASVFITELNASYALKREGLRFDNSDMHFDHFTITDAQDNTVTINGIIYTKVFSDFRFDLDIVSNDFLVLNTVATVDALYYGTLYLDSHIRIGGVLRRPEIQADLTILDKTHMTVIIPQEAPGIVEREGVVHFVDLEHPHLDSILATALDTLNTFAIKGLVVYANIHVSDDSEFKLIIDQGSGDFLRLRGNAELNVGIDPSGKINMTGNYILEEGIYELSFNFLKRRFEIQKGSTITWNGEPTSGVINVKAVYIVEAAPIDLVARQLADATQTELNLYKEKLPFHLILSLTGTLTKPEVSFDIALPEGNYPVAPDVITTVQARLEQLGREESEINKQAFALVLLNRFISDDPFRSMAGSTSAESYARQSVSKLLSQQLNNLTVDLISGVDLRFDIDASEDYSTGQLQNRTDLNVSASKRLLDDRITLTVGSNFELEGTREEGEKSGNIAGDISVEYQLSKDGRYLLKAYRKNEYQVAVEGQVVKTGLSFVIHLDYDRFIEIFKKKKES
jgi:hypothetical protein